MEPPRIDSVETVTVDSGSLSEADLLRLSQARTVLGTAPLVNVVRHLCPPTTQLQVIEDVAIDSERIAESAAPVVVLRSSAAGVDSLQIGLQSGLPALIDAVPEVDSESTDSARLLWDSLAKPPGSLGMLEAVGAQLAGITRQCPPAVPTAPAVIVAAADHGVVKHGVSVWPSKVTAAMVRTCLAGKAAVSVFSAGVGAPVTVLDVGVAEDLVAAPGLVRANVRPGTRDMLAGPAMSVEELLAAVNAGAQLCSELIHDGSDLIALGDLGIGNTTASACLVAAFSGAAVDEVVGRGAGVTDGVMSVKQRVVSEALSFHDAVELAKNDPAAALAACGGLEHAALVGVMLAAAARSVPVVLDGVISVASALAACRMAPDVRAVLLAGHESAEPGARVGLAHLGLSPLLRLDLHLGEGTGAVLAIPLIQAAVRAMHDMARLAEVVPAGAAERAPAGAAEGVPAED